MGLMTAFSHRGNCYELDVSSAGSTSVATDQSEKAGGNIGGLQYELSNQGAVPLFWTFGPPAPSAVPVAAIPTNGSPASGRCLGPGVTATYTLCAGAVIAAITASGTAKLYIAVGEGL